jgi:hypothetical protein
MYHMSLLKMSNEQRLAAVSQAFKDTGHQDHVDEDSETFRIANHIVTQDLELLRKADDAEDLESHIRTAAAEADDNCYAELNGDEGQEAEASLGWVCFDELWGVLASAAGIQ